MNDMACVEQRLYVNALCEKTRIEATDCWISAKGLFTIPAILLALPYTIGWYSILP